MAQQTQLQPDALPGKVKSFSPKEAAPIGGPHTGLFTQLSPAALPGRRKTFEAKTETIPPVEEEEEGGLSGWFKPERALERLRKRRERRKKRDVANALAALLLDE